MCSTGALQKLVAVYFHSPESTPRRFLVEMRRLFDGWAQLAVGVDATGQQVMQQPLLHLLQLGDDRLGLADGGVEVSRTLLGNGCHVECWGELLHHLGVIQRRTWLLPYP